MLNSLVQSIGMVSINTLTITINLTIKWTYQQSIVYQLVWIVNQFMILFILGNFLFKFTRLYFPINQLLFLGFQFFLILYFQICENKRQL